MARVKFGDRIVTMTSHPKLFGAFDVIRRDCGGANRYEPEKTRYRVPYPWSASIDASEAALSRLSADDLETFCIGDQDEALELCRHDTALRVTHDMLNAYFDSRW